MTHCAACKAIVGSSVNQWIMEHMVGSTHTLGRLACLRSPSTLLLVACWDLTFRAGLSVEDVSLQLLWMDAEPEGPEVSGKGVGNTGPLPEGGSDLGAAAVMPECILRSQRPSAGC